MMSRNRVRPEAGWVNQSKLARGPNGRALCRWCGVEVPKGRRTFCSEPCVHHHKLRSDPGYVRRLVFQRDKGVCAACGLDTHELKTKLARLYFRDRYAELERLGFPTHRETYWDADHVVPVAEGGGECDLDNYRTLCLRCHREATAELMARLAARRQPAESYPLFDDADTSA